MVQLRKHEEDERLTEAQYRARLTAALEQENKQTELMCRHMVAIGTVVGLLLQVACERHGYAPEVVGGKATGRLIKAETWWAKVKRKGAFWKCKPEAK